MVAPNEVIKRRGNDMTGPRLTNPSGYLCKSLLNKIKTYENGPVARIKLVIIVEAAKGLMGFNF
jgi:hypothetical protein